MSSKQKIEKAAKAQGREVTTYEYERVWGGWEMPRGGYEVQLDNGAKYYGLACKDIVEQIENPVVWQ